MKPYYEHAGITIYHGDCREVLCVIVTNAIPAAQNLNPVWMEKNGVLAAKHIDVIDHTDGAPDVVMMPSGTPLVLLTDPPYPNRSGWFREFAYAAIERLNMASPNVVEAIVFWSELDHLSMAGLYLVAAHVWHRSNVNGDKYEIAYHYSRNPERHPRSDLMSAAAVFDGVGPGCNEYAGHPTQKNLRVMRWLALKLPDGVILDPFMGSGTTLVAAKQLSRRAIGIEIEERYCEIAAKRLAQETLSFGDDDLHDAEPKQAPLLVEHE